MLLNYCYYYYHHRYRYRYRYCYCSYKMAAKIKRWPNVVTKDSHALVCIQV